ncbi:GNAT family N-acetyltransferase [Actinosynnema sp. NPDC020468]|uniref:GNAT family N-acetyltransferase n=1 Tax=Actinosynnema sp. NPDC020468 TaxID=3154488 RepID=UPI0033FA9B24
MRGVRVLDRRAAARAVDQVFGGMSARSRYLRFHAPVPRLTGAMRHGLSDLDGVDRVALVVERRGRAIGIGRLIRTGADTAELALAVVDAWQRRGVGTRLLSALVDLAAELGYASLCGDVLEENLAMLRLVRRFGGRVVPCDGVVRVTYPITLTHEDLIVDLGW